MPCKVTSCCGSVLAHLIPKPRDTGVVSAPLSQKLLLMVGIGNSYTLAGNSIATLGNFAKTTFDAISKTYTYFTPTSGKRPCSPSLPTRKLLTIL